MSNILDYLIINQDEKKINKRWNRIFKINIKIQLIGQLSKIGLY